MAELIVRGIDPEVVSKLTQRAESHRRTVEEEHRAILHETLLDSETETTTTTFEQYLRQMPDVGEDVDFGRITGAIREADLAD